MTLFLQDSAARGIDTVTVRIVDTVFVRDSSALAYQELLEKTNQQLSLWWNPYGVLIALLGVLFAVLAIVGAVLLFRQSREYRAMHQAEIDDYREIINTFITEKSSQIEVLKGEINAELTDARARLETAVGENKAQLEEHIRSLERVDSTLQARVESEGTLANHPRVDFNEILNSLTEQREFEILFLGKLREYYPTMLHNDFVWRRDSFTIRVRVPQVKGWIQLSGSRGSLVVAVITALDRIREVGTARSLAGGEEPTHNID